jgi:hypothetical protein
METGAGSEDSRRGAPAARDWRGQHAFGLPEGSIRAILAIALFATIWVLLVRRADHEVPDYLRNLLFIIMGHYFASRRRPPEEPAGGPGPLFLPRGTVRWVLFGGFACVAALLFQQGRLADPVSNPGVITLLLVVGFLLGVVVARFADWRRARGHPTPRWVEDLRAGIALAAAAVLIFLVWNRTVSGDDVETGLPIGPVSVENVMSALVGFYFGSRS